MYHKVWVKLVAIGNQLLHLNTNISKSITLAKGVIIYVIKAANGG